MASICSIVVTTVPDSKAGDSIAASLLEQKLAACVNQIPGVKSTYWWEDKINYADETFLFIKTQKSLVRKVIECVKKNHPYSVPEIISLPISDGSKPYLDWIKTTTSVSRKAKR